MVSLQPLVQLYAQPTPTWAVHKVAPALQAQLLLLQGCISGYVTPLDLVVPMLGCWVANFRSYRCGVLVGRMYRMLCYLIDVVCLLVVCSGCCAILVIVGRMLRILCYSDSLAGLGYRASRSRTLNKECSQNAEASACTLSQTDMQV